MAYRATRVVTGVFGIGTGLLGLLHGIPEIRQGNRTTTGLLISAVGRSTPASAGRAGVADDDLTARARAQRVGPRLSPAPMAAGLDFGLLPWEALIEGVVRRLAELDQVDLARGNARRASTLSTMDSAAAAPALTPADLDGWAAAFAALLNRWLSADRNLTLARYACLLEATHRPQLRHILGHGTRSASRRRRCSPGPGVRRRAWRRHRNHRRAERRRVAGSIANADLVSQAVVVVVPAS